MALNSREEEESMVAYIIAVGMRRYSGIFFSLAPAASMNLNFHIMTLNPLLIAVLP